MLGGEVNGKLKVDGGVSGGLDGVKLNDVVDGADIDGEVVREGVATDEGVLCVEKLNDVVEGGVTEGGAGGVTESGAGGVVADKGVL